MILTREEIIENVINSIKETPFANAAWEVGAVAFNRVDEWSDIDIVVDCDDDKIADLFKIIEKGFDELSEVELRLNVPFSQNHEFRQKFYRFRDAGKFRILDLAILKTSALEKYLEKEIHSNVKVFFDKKGITDAKPVDRKQFAKKILGTVNSLKKKFEMFHPLVEKEFHRKNSLEAVNGFHSLILPTLNTLFRIKANPFHYDFKARYLHYELDKDTVELFESLHFYSDIDELKSNYDRALDYISKLFNELDEKRIRDIVEKF